MFVVVVVAVPPGVVGEVLVDAEELAYEDVHLERGEEVAVGQVVELHEDAEGVAPVDEPPQESPPHRDQEPGYHLPHDGDSDR